MSRDQLLRFFKSTLPTSGRAWPISGDLCIFEWGSGAPSGTPRSLYYFRTDASTPQTALYTSASGSWAITTDFSTAGLAADVITESTAAAGVTIDGTLCKDGRLFNADLVLDSTNEINVTIGQVSLLAIDDAAITGNTAAAATAGKGVFIETQDAGASAADTSGAAGASITITPGIGAAGGAHTANNPNGGASGCVNLVTQAGGAAGSGGSGLAGANGAIRLNGLVVVKQGAPTAKTTAVTLTAAELLTGIITGTHSAGATQAYTLPTGTDMDNALHADIGADEAFDWYLINLSAAAIDTITLTANTAHTIVGNPIVQSAHSTTGGIYGNSAKFRTRRTAANTMITYRIA